MSRITLNLFVIVTLLVSGMASCKTQQRDQSKGTLSGTLGLLEGNCMPGPGQKPCKPVPVAGMLYITQPNKEYDQRLLIDSIQVEEDGLFSIQLPAGKYSVFVQDEDQITCTVTNCPDECYCLLVEVQTGEETVQDVTINHATW